GPPLDATEMALVRTAYAADLPTPDEVIRKLGEARRENAAPTAGASELPPQPRPEQIRSDQARHDVSARGSRGAVAAATPMPAPAQTPKMPAPAQTPNEMPAVNAGEFRAVKSF